MRWVVVAFVLLVAFVGINYLMGESCFEKLERLQLSGQHEAAADVTCSEHYE
jgi:hypothetical protein